MAEKSKPITAFTVPGRGLFQFRRLPFGLHNSPATWQRLIDRVLGPELEPYVFVYLDDIVVVTQDFDKHLEVLDEVFRRLISAGLTVNRSKCNFCLGSLKFLGYVVDREGLHVDPDKVKAIIDVPDPRSVSEVRRILGMASWYRRFIPGFSTVVSPLTELLRKGARFQWAEAQAEALSTIKSHLMSSPVMSCPNFDRPFVIQTDASDFGLGGVLVQIDDDSTERVISYISRSLSKSERKFSTTEKECLAVVWAIEKFRPYVEGSRFTVMTDHFALCWLHKLREPSGRLARWSVKLQQYDFEVVHRRGKDNVIPDALSRSVPVVAAVDPVPADPQFGDITDRWYISMVGRVLRSPLQFPLWRVDPEGRLFKRGRNPYPGLGDTGSDWLLVIPKNYRRSVIHDNHDLPTSGHLGVYKTAHRITDRYYWPKMQADICKYVAGCHTCAQVKPEQRRPAGLFVGRQDVSRPWEFIFVDLVGPLPRSGRGYTYILSILDYFTKFCLFLPLRSASAGAISQLIEDNVFLFFGAPRVLVADNGRQFRSHEFTGLLRRYRTQLQHTPNYHPQSNAVERAHRTLKTALSAFVNDNHRLWQQKLQQVACAMRTSRSEVTKVTPYFANFGRDICLSGDLTRLVDDTEDPPKLDDRNEGFAKLYADIRKRLAEASQRSQRHYNLRRRDVQFELGDKVWRRNFTLSDAARFVTSKLAHKFVGPFTVVKRITPWSYELQDENGPIAGSWHVKDLKPYTDNVDGQ